jgi:poly [ADP-ribose] polymerase
MKKFKDKTGNNWSERATFVVKSKKYEIIETTNEPAKPRFSTPTVVRKAVVSPACKLDPVTQDLIELITSSDMFKQAMAEKQIDVERLPLGQITAQQVLRGFNALLEIKADLTSGRKNLADLSSKFYQVIPHAFTRSQRPPVISSMETLAEKFDMLNMLSDIAVAQHLIKDDSSSSTTLTEHPLDSVYREMAIDLELLNENSENFELINTYIKNTLGSNTRMRLEHVWKLSRHPEDSTFAEHASLGSRSVVTYENL